VDVLAPGRAGWAVRFGVSAWAAFHLPGSRRLAIATATRPRDGRQEGFLSTPNEARTRRELIDPALARAGWDVDDPARVRVVIPVDGFDPAAWQALSLRLRGMGETAPVYDLPSGVSDYTLYRPNGEIIAIVEAKRTSKDPRLAQTQAEFYIDQIGLRQSFRLVPWPGASG